MTDTAFLSDFSERYGEETLWTHELTSTSLPWDDMNAAASRTEEWADYQSIQKRVAYVMMLDLFCVFLPGFLMGMCCGAWSDR